MQPLTPEPDAPMTPVEPTQPVGPDDLPGTEEDDNDDEDEYVPFEEPAGLLTATYPVLGAHAARPFV